MKIKSTLNSLKQNELAKGILLLPALFYTIAQAIAFYTDVPSVKVIFFALLILLILSRPFWSCPRIRKDIWPLVVFAIVSFAFAGLSAIKAVFGSYTIGSFLYHVKLGTIGVDYYSLVPTYAFFSILWLFALISAANYYGRGQYGKQAIYGLIIISFASNPVVLHAARYTAFQLGFLHINAAPELSALYVRPEISLPPENRKNVIFIYLEGLERTYRDQQVFGKSYQPLMDMEKTALQFTNVRQVSNTGWSVAGMAASQCGVPLSTPSIFSDIDITRKDRFLPKVTCLGDILANAGYAREYLVGANLEFGGIDSFYLTHRFDRLISKYDMAHIEPGDRNEWGLNDSGVFIMAQQRVVALENGSTPYLLVIETIGPHGLRAYLSKSCRGETQDPNTTNILEAVHCTGSLVRDFVQYLQKTVDMDNTLIVVLSDHLTHPNNMTPVLKTMERRNTIMMFGAGLAPNIIDKPGAMFDVFPTILEAMGVKLPNSQAGIGVSLLSDQPTLLEQFSIESLNAALDFDGAFAQELWAE
ncbi:MAG: sulfatase-like hydrolase/transferase [Paracoccaceae bacterium]